MTFWGEVGISRLVVGVVSLFLSDFGEKMHEEIMTREELPHMMDLGDLYVIFPLIDYKQISCKYLDAKHPQNPVVASDMGGHMDKKQINTMLDRIYEQG